ncbi:Aste57867_20759 [Aphanomyces stellatus]|uniref:Aste57867_20759 protein n=1 Tax=Aphanomyces stellatus TaxID=120398 RepID=A0A485LFV9_9STRA|nr:hypothetical protein As57867_020691 [Aphanomyces stellatus]VFT97438.1 Aste57867_20759 [Aphanomyces stellatus]
MKHYLPLALGATMLHTAAAGICNALVPGTWTQAAQSNPQLSGAINELSKYAVATWYTDRFDDVVSTLLSKCDGQTPAIVIYGLPGKDCADGYSASGKNQNADQYKAWIQNLVTRVGTRDVIYVLEPDAVGLLSNNQCAQQKGYLANLQAALGVISAGNPNAKVYVDVAGWAKQDEAAKVLNQLKSAGRLAGITINTSNYKTNAQLMSTCQYYSNAAGGLHCVFDTSRNHRGSINDEWCNSGSAGIGAPPGPVGGLVDYNLWLKVPGESDGTCNGRSPDALSGPNAGDFFVGGFTSLWNNGYFVDKEGLPKIGGGGGSWPSTSPSVTPAASTTSTPSTTTAAPATTTAPPTITTAAPTTTTEVPATTTAFPSDVPTTAAPTTSPYVADTPSSYETLATTSAVPSTTSTPIQQVSVQAEAAPSGVSAPMAILIGAIAVAGVVATVLAITVIRKRNMREKDNDCIERDSRGIVILGATPSRDIDVL